MYKRFMGDFTFCDSASRKFSLIFISSVNFTSDQPAPSLIFFQLQPGIKTLFFVLNICYEHTTLV